MVDTFEKMDAINPTFDLGPGCGRVMKISEVYFPTLTIYSGLSHLFNKRIPILTELNLYLTCCAEYEQLSAHEDEIELYYMKLNCINRCVAIVHAFQACHLHLLRK
jgi:hypothetical protein